LTLFDFLGDGTASPELLPAPRLSVRLFMSKDTRLVHFADTRRGPMTR